MHAVARPQEAWEDVPREATERVLHAAPGGVLRFLTAGSVDDGKSTMIGRLLYDTKAILADQLAAIERSSQRRGQALDLSLLTDGLTAEREQGITIDVAYRYFATPRRKFIVADAPGHEQYTRNMVTAASTAQLAVLLVDAQRGITTQTRRHATLARLLGIGQFVVAVNKMDAVGYDERVFRAIKQELAGFAYAAGIDQIEFVPMSALAGDMVVERGANMRWFQGPTLLECLESAGAGAAATHGGLRFPVQYVRRPAAQLPRGYMGRIESGSVAVGDAVTVLPSGIQTRIRAIETHRGPRPSAALHDALTLVLEDEFDVSRGDILVSAGEAEASRPRVTSALDAVVCWLADAPLDGARRYLLRHGTREVVARVDRIDHLLDVTTHAHLEPRPLERNDIAGVKLALARPIAAQRYDDDRAMGSFVLIDVSTNNTVAAGMIQ